MDMNKLRLNSPKQLEHILKSNLSRKVIDHSLVDPVDKLDHADDAEAAEEAKRATYGSDLVHQCHLDVPLHIGHRGLSNLYGHLGYVPLNLGGNSMFS